MTFSIEKMIKGKSEAPMKQMVNIIVNEYGRLDSGAIAISPKLISPIEVDEAVNSLISELEKIRKSAKAALKVNE